LHISIVFSVRLFGALIQSYTALQASSMPVNGALKMSFKYRVLYYKNI
jgi:hypothetical protein